jgi:hypothetical protein
MEPGPEGAEHVAFPLTQKGPLMKQVLIGAAVAAAACLAAAPSGATGVNTNSAGVVSAFQSGIAVNDFEAVATRTPQAITSYTTGEAVSADAFVFNQIAGVQFSVGGGVGTNMPALFSLGAGIAGDAKSGSTVLGPVDFDFTTKFGPGAFIEVFFPTKVSKVGFWLNPSLGNVTLIAADTNFAFSGLPETTLETSSGTAGNFVGIERATADIGGFKIIAVSDKAFTVDDFSFGATAVPEPGTYALMAAGLALLAARRIRRPPARL